MDSGFDFAVMITGGVHPAPERRVSATIRLISVSILVADGMSALLMAKMSAISMIPAFIACTTSPASGGITRTSVSTWTRAASSAWPTPTVSTMHFVEAESIHRVEKFGQIVGQPVGGRPRAERADEYVLGAGEVVHANAVAEDGAAAHRAAWGRSPGCRGGPERRRASASCPASVLLPAPGGPVRPDATRTRCRAARCCRSRAARRANSQRASAPVRARAGRAAGRPTRDIGAEPRRGARPAAAARRSAARNR